jgi:hypothetical protein
MVQRDQMSSALVDYPPYTPPPWTTDELSTDGRSIVDTEYKGFFFAHRERRLDALRMFLAKFNISADLDDAGVMAVSAWCPLYADLLVDGLESETVWSAYHEFAAAWVGPLIGLNAIFDLGVYYGECILLRNPKLKWLPLRGPAPHNVAHPIFGQKSRRPFDPIKWIYITCRNIYNEKTWNYARIGGPHTKGDDLYRHIHWQAVA